MAAPKFALRMVPLFPTTAHATLFTGCFQAVNPGIHSSRVFFNVCGKRHVPLSFRGGFPYRVPLAANKLRPTRRKMGGGGAGVGEATIPLSNLAPISAK
jgi:hypothetical protein